MSAVCSDEKQNNPPISKGEEDVRQYMHEIRQYPRLTAQEELQLARRCAEGNEEAIRTMVNSNLRLVVSIAREYCGRGVPLLDLVQEGSVGLLHAAKKFDPERELRFSTYATKWIRQCITRYILNQSSLIRVPRHTAEKMRKLVYSRTALLQQLGTVPTVEQIADHSGIPPKKVEELLALMPEICSIDNPVGEDAGDDNLHALLGDMQAAQPHEELIRQELNNTLELLLHMLTQRQQLVLRLRHGLEDGQTHTLEEIGDMLGISKEGARQIESRAINRLQKLAAELGLEDFLS